MNLINIKNRTNKYIFSVICFLIVFCFSLSTFAAEPNTNSKACFLMETSTSKILYDKNMNERLYPASTTKIMTAILVLENCNLTDVVTVGYNAVFSIPAGYATADLELGEQLSVEDLLNILLIPSANDAAIALAEHVAGSVENFANMMNSKAKELGCKDTNFVNPNGVHNESHYSTAYDLGLIAKHAMQNDIFASIVSKTSCTLPASNKYAKSDRSFKTTNSLLISSSKYFSDLATGVKTGLTSPAGGCLIFSSSKDGMNFVGVVLGGRVISGNSDERFADSISLINYGYNDYFLSTLNQKSSVLQQIEIKNATKDTKNLNVIVENDITALLKSEDSKVSYTPTITFNNDLKAPIKKGDIIGTISYNINDIEYNSNLLAENDVKESHFWLIFSIVIIIVLFILFRIKVVNSKKHSKMRKKYNSKKTYKY